jgi:hypothetical protein
MTTTGVSKKRRAPGRKKSELLAQKSLVLVAKAEK